MGMNVFDPDEETLPDFRRDVLGLEASATEPSQDMVLNGNPFLLLVYGFMVGFVT